MTDKTIRMNRQEWEARKKEMADIPQKYKERLQALLEEMEAETHDMYQFTINKFGNSTNYNYVVGEFKSRDKPIVIYGMKEGYEALEGGYATRNAAVQKLKELVANDRFEETNDWVRESDGHVFKLGKCRKCHSYNENAPEYPVKSGDSTIQCRRFPNTIESNVCQNIECGAHLESKWSDLTVSENDFTVYECGGGSLSVCKTKGLYKFV